MQCDHADSRVALNPDESDFHWLDMVNLVGHFDCGEEQTHVSDVVDIY